MRYAYEMYRYLMLVNKNLTLELFLQRAGAKQGFAKQMFTNMYNSIFAECHYVEEEYEQYYQLEYPDLYHYLHTRYNVEIPPLNLLIEEKNKSLDYIFIEYSSLSCGDGSIDDLMFQDKLSERMENILLLR